jgi:predicted enzyme related to lactoylglutathione lyase
MSEVTTRQPTGTPVWVDLGIPDLDRAMEFYGALFGWEFQVGPPEAGNYTMCLARGERVAAIAPNPDPDARDFWWTVYFATDDCDATAKRIVEAGGTMVDPPLDVMDQGRSAIARDPVGAPFGLWQAGEFVGARLVNEPSTLMRNDLVTPTPEPARAFYTAVFDFTLDGNPDLPGADFTYLRRPDGHEIGGIMGDPTAAASRWGTLFLVEDADKAAEAARAAGGSAEPPFDMVYGRLAQITDPFGATFTVGAAAAR